MDTITAILSPSCSITNLYQSKIYVGENNSTEIRITNNYSTDTTMAYTLSISRPKSGDYIKILNTDISTNELYCILTSNDLTDSGVYNLQLTCSRKSDDFIKKSNYFSLKVNSSIITDESELDTSSLSVLLEAISTQTTEINNVKTSKVGYAAIDENNYLSLYSDSLKTKLISSVPFPKDTTYTFSSNGKILTILDSNGKKVNIILDQSGGGSSSEVLNVICLYFNGTNIYSDSSYDTIMDFSKIYTLVSDDSNFITIKYNDIELSLEYAIETEICYSISIKAIYYKLLIKLDNTITYEEINMVDNELSDSSIRPVQNKILKAALDSKQENLGITSKDVSEWNASKEKAHEHSNKSVLDAITSAIVEGWNTAKSWVSTNGANVLSHLSNTTVHITSAERTAWDGKQDALTTADKQAIADLHTDAVTSVNGQTGAVTLTILSESEVNTLIDTKLTALGTAEGESY